MYATFIRTIYSTDIVDEVASTPKSVLIYAIERCQLRNRILRNNCVLVLEYMGAQMSYTTRHRQRLIEIDKAFLDGLLDGQHLIG